MKGDQNHPFLEILEKIFGIEFIRVIRNGIVLFVQLPPFQYVFWRIKIPVVKVGISRWNSATLNTSKLGMDWFFPSEPWIVFKEQVVAPVKRRVKLERLDELVKVFVP